MNNDIFEKMGKALKTILSVITAPIWYPWKLLFGRDSRKKDEGNRLRGIGGVTVGIVKLALFVAILFLEAVLVHKIRYSPMTYPFTRNSVREYYLNENRLELVGIDQDQRDELEVMLDYIEKWDLSEKNKMNVILNSDLVKKLIRYSDDETVDYIVNKFNRDETFRNDVRLVIREIDTSITRFIKELPESDFNRLSNFLNPIVAITSWALDYASVLEIGDAVFDWAKGEYDIREKSLHVFENDIDKALKTALDYSNESSLSTVIEYWK